MKSTKLLNDALDHFAKNDCYPGDWWAFTDDGSELCLEYAEGDARFWIDLNRDGTVTLLWRPTKDAAPQIAKFAAL